MNYLPYHLCMFCFYVLYCVYIRMMSIAGWEFKINREIIMPPKLLNMHLQIAMHLHSHRCTSPDSIFKLLLRMINLQAEQGRIWVEGLLKSHSVNLFCFSYAIENFKNDCTKAQNHRPDLNSTLDKGSNNKLTTLEWFQWLKNWYRTRWLIEIISIPLIVMMIRQGWSCTYPWKCIVFVVIFNLSNSRSGLRTCLFSLIHRTRDLHSFYSILNIFL